MAILDELRVALAGLVGDMDPATERVKMWNVNRLSALAVRQEGLAGVEVLLMNAAEQGTINAPQFVEIGSAMVEANTALESSFELRICDSDPVGRGSPQTVGTLAPTEWEGCDNQLGHDFMLTNTRRGASDAGQMTSRSEDIPRTAFGEDDEQEGSTQSPHASAVCDRYRGATFDPSSPPNYPLSAPPNPAPSQLMLKPSRAELGEEEPASKVDLPPPISTPIRALQMPPALNTPLRYPTTPETIGRTPVRAGPEPVNLIDSLASPPSLLLPEHLGSPSRDSGASPSHLPMAQVTPLTMSDRRQSGGVTPTCPIALPIAAHAAGLGRVVFNEGWTHAESSPPGASRGSIPSPNGRCDAQGSDEGVEVTVGQPVPLFAPQIPLLTPVVEDSPWLNARDASPASEGEGVEAKSHKKKSKKKSKRTKFATDPAARIARSCTIHATGLSSEMTDQEHLNLFACFGTVKKYQMCGTRDRKTFFAFVEFSNTLEATQAVAACQGPLTLKWGTSRFMPKFEMAKQAICWQH
eukprot:Hpha_TRINITY_DN15462_c0_g5::TRINITY_DN15462_c0_g5_i1::g.175668::m.175668